MQNILFKKYLDQKYDQLNFLKLLKLNDFESKLVDLNKKIDTLSGTLNMPQDSTLKLQNNLETFENICKTNLETYSIQLNDIFVSKQNYNDYTTLLDERLKKLENIIKLEKLPSNEMFDDLKNKMEQTNTKFEQFFLEYEKRINAKLISKEDHDKLKKETLRIIKLYDDLKNNVESAFNNTNIKFESVIKDFSLKLKEEENRVNSQFTLKMTHDKLLNQLNLEFRKTLEQIEKLNNQLSLNDDSYMLRKRTKK